MTQHEAGVRLGHMLDASREAVARKKLWLEVAERRLAEMREGKVREIPADEVFARGRAVTSR